MKYALLVIDDASLPLRKNACPNLSRPARRREPGLLPSPPVSNTLENLAPHLYGTVLPEVFGATPEEQKAALRQHPPQPQKITIALGTPREGLAS